MQESKRDLKASAPSASQRSDLSLLFSSHLSHRSFDLLSILHHLLGLLWMLSNRYMKEDLPTPVGIPLPIRSGTHRITRETWRFMALNPGLELLRAWRFPWGTEMGWFLWMGGFLANVLALPLDLKLTEGKVRLYTGRKFFCISDLNFPSFSLNLLLVVLSLFHSNTQVNYPSLLA